MYLFPCTPVAALPTATALLLRGGRFDAALEGAGARVRDAALEGAGATADRLLSVRS